MTRRLKISEARGKLPQLAKYLARHPAEVVLVDHRDLDDRIALTTEGHLRYLEAAVRELKKQVARPFRLAGSISSDLSDEELEAALGAMSERMRDRCAQHEVAANKLVPEGIEGRVPHRGALATNIEQLVGGLQAGMGYVGAADLPDLRRRAKFIRISDAGQRESHVHDVFVTKEAPNYRP